MTLEEKSVVDTWFCSEVPSDKGRIVDCQTHSTGSTIIKPALITLIVVNNDVLN